MTKEHLIGRIARAMRKSSFDNAEEHFKCAEDLSKISIEYAISVLDDIRKYFIDDGASERSSIIRSIDLKIQDLKPLIS